MTHYKRIPGRYLTDHDECAVGILKIASATGRIDSRQLQKLSAGKETPLLNGLSCGSDESLIHAIAVGAHETWGANSNADSFNREPCNIYPLDPKEAEDRFYRADTGLVQCLPSYEREGGLYYEHRNRTKGAKKKGDIVLSFYNRPMDRGELVIRVKNAEHPALLSSIEAGEPTFVSQGCSVPEDVCSVCLNRAKTPKQYCNHMKSHKLEMLKTGGRVFVWNPKPTFHDISVVKTPAFIPAFILGMRRGMSAEDAYKAASMVVTDSYGVGTFVKVAGLEIPDYAVIEFLRQSRPSKMALVEKISKMEKEIPLAVSNAVIGGVVIPEETRIKLSEAVKRRHPADIVSSMKMHSQLLPPAVFMDILKSEQPEGRTSTRGYRRALRTVFQDLQEDPDALSEVVDNDDYSGGRPVADNGILKDFREDVTLDPKTVLRKSELLSLSGKSPDLSHKTAALVSTDHDIALAREYARYMLSALDGLPDSMIKVAVLRKYWD